MPKSLKMPSPMSSMSLKLEKCQECEKGKLLLSIPVPWGAAGAVAMITLAPWLAALGVIAGFVARCKIEVEKSPDK